MSSVYNFGVSHSYVSGTPALERHHQYHRRNAALSSPTLMREINHTMCSRVNGDRAHFVNSSFDSLPTLRQPACLPSPGQPFLDHGLHIEQIFNVETSSADRFNWCFTDGRPTIPKRRRTSTGSVGLIDYAYLPATQELTSFSSRPQVGLSVQTPVSAILTTSMPTVQLVHGSWPPTTLCLQPNTRQHHRLPPNAVFPNRMRNNIDSGACQASSRNYNNGSNYRNHIQHGQATHRQYPHQRKRHFGRIRRDDAAPQISHVRQRRMLPASTKPDQSCCDGLLERRSFKVSPGQKNLGNSSKAGSPSIEPTCVSQCSSSTEGISSVECGEVLSRSRNSAQQENHLNSTTIRCGMQNQSDGRTMCTAAASVHHSLSSGLSNRESLVLPGRQHPRDRDSSPFPILACTVNAVSSTLPVDQAVSDQWCTAESCTEIEDAGQTLSNSLGPRADEATVVAAAAVASAAAHAVAAAAQAVSAAVHHRHGSDSTDLIIPTQPLQTSQSRPILNQLPTPQPSRIYSSSASGRVSHRPVPNLITSDQSARHIPVSRLAECPVNQTPSQPLTALLSRRIDAGFSRSLLNPMEFGTSSNMSQIGLASATHRDHMQTISTASESIPGIPYHGPTYPNVTIAAATQAAHAVAAAAAAQVAAAAAAAAVVSSSPMPFMSPGVQLNAIRSGPSSRFVSPGLVAPHPVQFGGSVLAVPSTLSQHIDANLYAVPSGMASVAAVAAGRVSAASHSATMLRMTSTSAGSPGLISVPHAVRPDRSYAQAVLIPQLPVAPQVTSVPILPISSTTLSAVNQASYSTTRDIQTLFQFLRLINQRQDPYALPYYPSAMTAMAGISNSSVVVSASMGNAAGTRVASAVTPPLAPHHPAVSQATTLTALMTPTLVQQQSTAVSGLLIPHPTISNQSSNVHPASSTAVALAAVAMAAAAALQQQTNHHIPANVMSMLSAPPAAPTPSIPVPILHAHSYRPTSLNTVPPVAVSHNPCHHAHHGVNHGNQQHTTYERPAFSAVTTSIAAPSAYSAGLFPFFVTVPASPTRSASDPPDLSSTLIAHLASSHLVTTAPAPVLPAAAAALAAAAEAAAASVDTLYQLAVQLESSGRRGLTKDELDTLPVRLYGQKSGTKDGLESDSTESEDRCMICLDDYNSQDLLRAMRCSHEFHASCVDKWLKTKRTCPLCRADAFDGSQHKDELI